jgi:hypothetical protein
VSETGVAGGTDLLELVIAADDVNMARPLRLEQEDKDKCLDRELPAVDDVPQEQKTMRIRKPDRLHNADKIEELTVKVANNETRRRHIEDNRLTRKKRLDMQEKTRKMIGRDHRKQKMTTGTCKVRDIAGDRPHENVEELAEVEGHSSNETQRTVGLNLVVGQNI